MASICSANCADFDLIANPTAGCTTDIRETIFSRIGFFLCSTALPDPITCMNIAPLFADGSIVLSSKLGNVVIADPTTEDVLVDDCSPALKRIVGRTITAEDRVAITLTSGSPAVTNNYLDYAFWQDKLNANIQLRYMFIYCNGDVKIPRDKYGNYMTAQLQAYLSYQKASTQGAQSIEFKKLQLDFAGDPFNMVAPDFNLVECEIEF